MRFGDDTKKRRNFAVRREKVMSDKSISFDLFLKPTMTGTSNLSEFIFWIYLDNSEHKN